MEPVIVTGALELISRVSKQINSYGQHVGNKTLVDISQSARVEPIVLLDADCVNEEITPDLMQNLFSLFTGYYLQAVSMVTTIGGTTVASKLDPLNPNRGIGFESIYNDMRKTITMEDYKFRLPKYNINLENKAESPVVDKTGLELVKEASSLSIGKVINLDIKHEDKTVTIPIAIRLLVNVIPSKILADLFSYRDSLDMDVKERFHGWLSGRLSLFSDLVLCNDLINKRIKAGINDKSGVSTVISERESKNTIAGLTTGKASLAKCSNIAVISNNTLDKIELEINGKISNSKTRKALFENTNLMILAVMDKDYARVVIYTNGLDSSTSIGYKELKNKAKGGGMDINDVLKAYVAGTSPI